MSIQRQADVVDRESVGEYEVVDLGHGSVDDTGPPADFGLLEIDPIAQPATGGAPQPDAGRSPRGAALALALVFTLGLTTGIVASQARGDAAADAPLALEAGRATANGRLVPLSASFAATSVDVPAHNTGSQDVTVVSAALVGWSKSDPSIPREPVTVPTGQTRTVGTAVGLDCERPKPPTATIVEVRVRTDDLGVISMTMPLSEPARDLSTLWEQFCSAAGQGG